MAMATRDITERVRARDQWYHTLELAPGLLTPGWFDHRTVAAKVLPARLDGLRCLDVGTFDGFWAFEMEKRGAREVLAVDIVDPLAWDWPLNSGADVIAALESRKEGGRGFSIACEALGSGVRYEECSIYDLDETVHGRFDVVFVGSLLLHLRDPVRALERVRGVCSGRVVTMDAIDPWLSLGFRRQPLARLNGDGRPWWWMPNLACYERLVRAAGLVPERPPLKLRLPVGAGQPKLRPTTAILRNREGRRRLGTAYFGDPHATITSRPA